MIESFSKLSLWQLKKRARGQSSKKRQTEKTQIIIYQKPNNPCSRDSRPSHHRRAFFGIECEDTIGPSEATIDPITKSIASNAPIKISFSSAMHHKKTEDAFSIAPKVPGRFAWESNTMLYIPEEDFTIGDSYSVIIAKNG